MSSLPSSQTQLAVALNNCAQDRLHKDHCMQAFGRNTLSKPHSTSLRTQGRGIVPLEFKVRTNIFTVKLKDIKHTPEVPNNLISIGCLMDIGHSATFTSTSMEFKTKKGTIFGMGRKVSQMYQVRCQVTANRGAKEFCKISCILLLTDIYAQHIYLCFK